MNRSLEILIFIIGMKIIPNNTNKLIGNLAQGCVVKPEIIIKNEVDYSYSRLLDEEFYWIKTREDKKIARTQGKIPTFPKRYTDLFSYKKNYTTITREDFSKKKQSKFYGNKNNFCDIHI